MAGRGLIYVAWALAWQRQYPDQAEAEAGSTATGDQILKLLISLLAGILISGGRWWWMPTIYILLLTSCPLGGYRKFIIYKLTEAK